MTRMLSYDTEDIEDMFDAMQKVVKDIQKKNILNVSEAGKEALAELRKLTKEN